MKPYTYHPVGPEAARLAGVWWLMFSMAVVVYVIVAGFIVVALLRGRGTEGGRASRLTENRLIWGGGVIVPTLILAVLAVVTVETTTHVRGAEPDPLKIDVVGKRWWWDIHYLGTSIVTANEVRVPVGRPIELGLLSDNVIHSWWVPQLGGKMDLVPGQRNVLRFTAKKAGVYRGECAEFCGLQHAKMNFVVVAEPRVDFDRWRTQHDRPAPEPSDEMAAKGQAVFMRAPCAGCHRIAGTEATGTLGPDLSDFGGRRTIGANTKPNTTGNLAGWIVDSQSIKPGNLMPPISLEPDEVQAVVAYLQSLK